MDNDVDFVFYFWKNQDYLQNFSIFKSAQQGPWYPFMRNKFVTHIAEQKENIALRIWTRPLRLSLVTFRPQMAAT
jgi:hypothetical protein